MWDLFDVRFMKHYKSGRAELVTKTICHCKSRALFTSKSSDKKHYNSRVLYADFISMLLQIYTFVPLGQEVNSDLRTKMSENQEEYVELSLRMFFGSV